MPKDLVYDKIREVVNGLVNEGANKRELSEVLKTFSETMSAWANCEG